MLVRYRGINNKGVLERPWTKWMVLRAISTTLKCQFTGKCWKVDFLMPCTTKSAETFQVAPYARCGPPGNPSTPWIPFKIMKKQFLWKTQFSRFTNKSLDLSFPFGRDALLYPFWTHCCKAAATFHGWQPVEAFPSMVNGLLVDDPNG